MFQPLLKRAKLPKVRFHDVRHTSATLPLSTGVPPTVVRERPGYARTSVTTNTYSHVLPRMQREAAAKSAEMLAVKAV